MLLTFRQLLWIGSIINTKLSEICAGVYVYDKKLYDEVKDIGRKKFTLSNGYPIQWESISRNTKYSRINMIAYNAFYVDKDEAKHIVYQQRGYEQKYFRLHFGGDEGRGFWFDIWDYHITTPIATGFPHHNVFI